MNGQDWSPSISKRTSDSVDVWGMMVVRWFSKVSSRQRAPGLESSLLKKVRKRNCYTKRIISTNAEKRELWDRESYLGIRTEARVVLLT